MDEEAPQHQLSNGTMLTPDAIADLLSPPRPGLILAKQLWNVGSEELDAVAEKLGDGSRDGEEFLRVIQEKKRVADISAVASWRRPLGDSGILDFFLSIVATQGLRPDLKKHMLRLIGNSCADTGCRLGRPRPHHRIPRRRRRFHFAVPVLYNILVDYEPAQAQASAQSLTWHLVDLLASTRLADAPHLVGIVVKILALLATHETEATRAPSQTPAVLLTLALAPTTDAEDFVSLTAVALAYLTHAPVQAAFIATGSVPVLLDTLYHLQTQLDALQIEDEDAAVQLRALPQSFIQVLADISYADEFPLRHPLGSPVLDTLQSWLSLPNPHLRAAACLCLGNVARSDEASFALLLHSALSFLKNLAIPSQNKPVLGDAGLFDPDVLPRVWALDANPQVQFSAVSLARLLLVNTPPNVRRLCAPLSPDPLSPSHETTQLHRLLDIFARSDAEHTRTEAARAAAVPLSPAALAEAEGDGSTKRRAKFYRQHAGLNKALAFLVTQTRFPVLCSEAWFVFALMCRAKDGADVVIRTLQVAGAFEALTEAITGQTFAAAEEARDGARAIEEGPAGAGQAAVVSGGSNAAMVEGLGLEPQQADPSQAAGMKKVDRENGLVMVTELVKKHADELPAARRAAFEDMLREGGEMLVDEKGKANA
ncbi:GTP binding protein [Colletotrichum higginsianum]|nr:GTP binding protein [Colletotrichum higginsianum]